MWIREGWDRTCRWNTKRWRKLIPQVRSCMPEWAFSDLEIWLNWWVKESDHWWRPCGSGWLNGNKITEVVWSRRLKEFLSRSHINSFSLLLHTTSVILLGGAALYTRNCTFWKVAQTETKRKQLCCLFICVNAFFCSFCFGLFLPGRTVELSRHNDRCKF